MRVVAADAKPWDAALKRRGAAAAKHLTAAAADAWVAQNARDVRAAAAALEPAARTTFCRDILRCALARDGEVAAAAVVALAADGGFFENGSPLLDLEVRPGGGAVGGAALALAPTLRAVEDSGEGSCARLLLAALTRCGARVVILRCNHELVAATSRLI